MGIANRSNIEAAQATYEAVFAEFFGEGITGTAGQIAEELPVSSGRLSIPAVASFPRVREWAGAKVYKDLRAFIHDIDVKSWEASVRLDRITVDGDTSGVVGSHLRSFLGSQVTAFDDMVWQKLLANPEGYDGVSLLNNSHPFSSGTGDNITTDALGHSSYRAALQAMRGFKDENGRPLNVGSSQGMFLFVPSSKVEIGLEVTGADKPVFFDNTGSEATSGVVGGVTIENVVRGSAGVVEVKWMESDQWLLADLSKPGLRPWLVPRFRAFEPVTQTDMDTEARFNFNEYRFSIEGDYGNGPGLWQLIYGNL